VSNDAQNPVRLEFVRGDTLEVINIGDLGNVYRNSSNNTLPIMIVNSGGRDAVNVKAKFIPATHEGNTDEIAYKWKQISYDTSSNFKDELDLPDIRAGEFMTGFKVYSESFNNIITTYLPPDWDTIGRWEIYSLTEGNNEFNSYVQHIADTVDITTGRVIPMHFPETRNCDVSVEIATPRYNFGGIQLRMNPVTGYGYAVIMYPDPDTIRQINEYYREIIGASYTPIDTYNESAIGIGKVNYRDLDNMAFPNIYNKFHWLPKGTDYRLERDTLRVELKENVFNVWVNDDLKGKYIDPNPILEQGRVSMIAGRRYDTRVIFDNLVYRIETNRGIIFVKSAVPANPNDSISNDNMYYSNLLIEYSE
jgi:hypothetical protein